MGDGPVMGFDYIYQEWINYLRGAEAFIGLPLCFGGTVLMLAGWRLWKIAAVVSLALVGLVLGHMASGATQFDWRWALVGAVVLGAAGAVFSQYAATALGGVVGGMVALFVLRGLGMYGPLQWVAGAVGFAAAMAWAYSYRQQVVAVITSVEGGVLLASGLAVMLPEVPLLYKFFQSMTATSPFMIGFFVLVPTVVGVTLQQADANRSTSKSVQG